ncbi:MAG: 50S ribosomal protein L13 [Candidatus Nealsonbacteria bacterium]|nr:MAG: 50S ribosomal protein L13 [Candidatus Nealsonbacteria bacterium]
MDRKTYTIDATGKPLGRLAVEIVKILRGKNKTDFDPSRDMGDVVVVKNVEKIKFTGKKLKQKIYLKHSGYIGGLKEIPLERLFEKNPKEVLRKAVWGMLPKNKLRKKMIKRLKII